MCKVRLSTIMDNGGWSSVTAFGKFYKKTIFPVSKAHGHQLLENIRTKDCYSYFSLSSSIYFHVLLCLFTAYFRQNFPGQAAVHCLLLFLFPLMVARFKVPRDSLMSRVGVEIEFRS